MGHLQKRIQNGENFSTENGEYHYEGSWDLGDLKYSLNSSEVEIYCGAGGSVIQPYK